MGVYSPKVYTERLRPSEQPLTLYIHKISLLAFFGPFTDRNCTFPLPCIWANDIPTYIYSWRIKKVPPFLAEPPPKGRYSESPSPSPGEPMIITRETSQFQQLIHSLGGRKFVYQEKRNQSLIIGYGLKLPYLVYNCLFSFLRISNEKFRKEIISFPDNITSPSWI